MNNQPLVSVIMNCYNSDKYLKEAIASVIVQTYENWEIIFWDNQSTDESAKILKSYDDKRIKYYYAPKHTLLGEARNLAVDKAKGEWLGILDCDDVWYADKLELQLYNIKDDVGMVYTRSEFLIENSGKESYMSKNIKSNMYPKRAELPFGDIFNELLYDCFIPLPSVLIRKDLFFKVKGINNNLKVAEDYDIFLRIAKVSNVNSIDKILCKYRVHSNNLSHTSLDVTFEESIALVSAYEYHPNINNYIIYWKMKYIKKMLKEKEFTKIFSQLLTMNPIIIIKLLISK
jgi:glycosyltransferase involved in cell wall biosynthesis